ncbi:unnamed protein product [Dibothriocephalus latus]|uniref:Ran-GTPase activating protein 1 C-terminal domain-containing protein n=1 Tax=Dibothriocephalus latus TaxID=60516 RepID=A0A3P7NYY4_DIBLA|nr:unnamed protein product [Dibothriocephalus latus]
MSADVIVDDALVDFADKSFKIDGKKEAKKIVQALKKCPQVAVLRLSGNTLGVEGAEAIGSELSNHPNLKHCLFSDLFTVGVTELLASPVCYTLQTLKMNNQGLGHQGCRHLTEALLKGLRDSNGSGPKLKTFSAGRNRLENYGAKLLAGVFSEMKSLEELHLYQNGIGIHGMDGIQCLVNAVALNSNLRVLNLSDNTLTADGGTELARSLVYLSNLEELILDDCLIRGRGCRSLANELERENVVPNLTCLRLYGNEITRDAGVHLALCLAGKKKLKHLNLNANEFGSEGIDMVIRTLESIDLIEALEIPPADRSIDDSVSDDVDPRYRAFDEDQGSDNEEEDDYEEGEYNEGEEAEDFEDDEVCPTESGLHSIGKSGDSSFQTVKERSVGGPFGYVPPKSTEKQTEAGGGVFSFRSVLSDIQNEANANHGSNLFSALDSTDASACRSKLWANASIGSKAAPVSGLFAPPRLGIVVTPPKVNPPSDGLFTTSAALQPAGVGSKFKEAEALDCLKRCMASPEDDELMRILAGCAVDYFLPDFRSTFCTKYCK